MPSPTIVIRDPLGHETPQVASDGASNCTSAVALFTSWRMSRLTYPSGLMVGSTVSLVHVLVLHHLIAGRALGGEAAAHLHERPLAAHQHPGLAVVRGASSTGRETRTATPATHHGSAKPRIVSCNLRSSLNPPACSGQGSR